MKRKKVGRTETIRQWVLAHRRLLFVWAPGAILLLLLLIQLAYPGDRLVPMQRVDEVSYGFAKKDSVIKSLDDRYNNTSAQLYFGEAKKPQFTPKLKDIGLAVENDERIQQLTYPWYWRIVPSSIVWMHYLSDVKQPNYRQSDTALERYLVSELKGSCEVAPKNATAKIVGAKVVVVPGQDGGVCKEQDVRKTLSSLRPSLPKQPRVRISMDPRPAALRSPDVQPIVATLNDKLSAPLPLQYDNATLEVPAKEVVEWLSFSVENDTLEVIVDQEKSDQYLHSNLDDALARPAGVTKVSTQDFVEVSREDGAPGRAIDTNATRVHIVEYLLAKTDAIPVGVANVEPKVEYTRNYSNSDTGLSALMKHYADTHPGTYGVSLIELDGKRRRASFNDASKFTTASTYKLYVAFSTLRRVESGEFKWSDQIAGGRSLEQCFEDMIAKSDNPCAEALVAKIGYRPITQDAHTVVSTNTTFLDTESYKTTAGDLSTFMASLATRQIPLRSDSIDRLTSALGRNVYRQGIPAGANGTVANKVGFLESFLHDAAIVYSPSGTYTLSVMTDGSSWANIAELTREIEKLRS